MFVVFLALAAAAFADTADRTAYKEAVEPICKVDKRSSDRLLTPVKSLVKRDRMKQAATAFTKAAVALETAHKQLAAVPQPPADTAKLSRWLSGIRAEAALMRTIATALRRGDKSKASSLSVKLTHDATTTNNQVIVFQFNYCKIDPSRYS